MGPDQSRYSHAQQRLPNGQSWQAQPRVGWKTQASVVWRTFATKKSWSFPIRRLESR
jgi:hypothetical protein